MDKIPRNSYIVYENDKVSINEITLKVPFHCILSFEFNDGVFNFQLTPLPRLDSINL